MRRPLVPDDGYRLLLGEPGAGGERLIEPGCAQPLADLGHQIGLDPPQMRPCPQANPPAQALGRAFQQRRPVRVTVCERQLSVPGQAQGHERGAAGRQAPVQRLLQQRPGLIGAAAHDIQDAQLYPGARGEPVTADSLRQVTRLSR